MRPVRARVREGVVDVMAVQEVALRARVATAAQGGATMKTGKMGGRRLALCVGAAAVALAAAAAHAVPVLLGADLAGWQTRIFDGETRYEMVNVDGRRALRADSAGSASSLYREIDVDLDATPIIEWTWRVDETLGDLDERTREGDDYPARVYVIWKHPLFFWKSRAVNYVWSNAQPVGATWPNAFTDANRHIAVRSGEVDTGRWLTERRDVREDFRRLFGESVDRIHGVAIMTDSDNSGGSVTAWYGDIRFAERSASR